MESMRSRVSLVKPLGTFLLLGMLLAGAAVRPTKAYEPEADFWYVETVTLDTSGLPAEFHVYTGINSSPEQFSEGVWLSTNSPDVSPRAMIYLINRSKTPVYVMSLEHRDRLVMETPDANFEARVKMAHEAASYLVRPGSGEIFTLNWEALRDLDASLTELNPPTFETPPADLTAPAPQHSELLLVYGEQVVLIPFTISYSVNPNFKIDEYVGPAGVPDPTTVPESKGVLNTGQKAVLVSAGVVLAAMIVWLVYRWRSKH
jgi:hypothetical protein